MLDPEARDDGRSHDGASLPVDGGHWLAGGNPGFLPALERIAAQPEKKWQEA